MRGRKNRPHRAVERSPTIAPSKARLSVVTLEIDRRFAGALLVSRDGGFEPRLIGLDGLAALRPFRGPQRPACSLLGHAALMLWFGIFEPDVPGTFQSGLLSTASRLARREAFSRLAAPIRHLTFAR